MEKVDNIVLISEDRSKWLKFSIVASEHSELRRWCYYIRPEMIIGKSESWMRIVLEAGGNEVNMGSFSLKEFSKLPNHHEVSTKKLFESDGFQKVVAEVLKRNTRLRIVVDEFTYAYISMEIKGTNFQASGKLQYDRTKRLWRAVSAR